MSAERPLLAAALMLYGTTSLGQAIVLDRGQMTAGMSYQHTFVRKHIGHDGQAVDIGHIMAWVLQPEFSYGLTNRVTLDATASFVSAKYIGHNPHGRLDDGTFHSTLQDFNIGARMNLVSRPLAVTPFLRLTGPTHSYQLEGHTAVGKGLFALTPGVYAGRDLGPFLRNAYAEAMLSHTFIQRTYIESTSERLNRTNGSLEVGYYVTPSVTLRAFASGVRTHGGWPLPRAFNNLNEIQEHDRFDKTHDLHTGAMVSYAWRDRLSVHAAYAHTQWARTAHASAGFTLGFIWSPAPPQQWLAQASRRSPVRLAQLQ